MDAGQGHLPAGTAEPIALRREPVVGAGRGTDVLADLAVLLEVAQFARYFAVVGVELLRDHVLHVKGSDGAVLPLDVRLNGVPDLCGMWSALCGICHGVPRRHCRAYFVALRRA